MIKNSTIQNIKIKVWFSKIKNRDKIILKGSQVLNLLFKNYQFKCYKSQNY
jgi:hypothetical protein